MLKARSGVIDMALSQGKRRANGGGLLQRSVETAPPVDAEAMACGSVNFPE